MIYSSYKRRYIYIYIKLSTGLHTYRQYRSDQMKHIGIVNEANNPSKIWNYFNFNTARAVESYKYVLKNIVMRFEGNYLAHTY